jgi:hypothetical protein
VPAGLGRDVTGGGRNYRIVALKYLNAIEQLNNKDNNASGRIVFSVEDDT